MRAILTRSVKTASILLALLLAAACDHREFLYEEPAKRVPVVVEFDWSADPDAAPGGMTAYFFREGSKASSPSAYDFKGRDGGTITLIPGIYRAVCHNNDSDRHGFTGYDSYDDFGIRLNDHRNAGTLNSNTAVHTANLDERIAHSPDSMWVAAIPFFEIETPASASPEIIIRFALQPVVNHYTFHIHNPVNFSNSLSVSATISGMAGTVHPAGSITGEEMVTHLFNMTPTSDGNLFGEILTFGHCSGRPIGARAEDDADGTHILTIRATLADGQLWTSTHDVTQQIHQSETPDCVIRLDSISFPKPTTGGGFSPNVGGWNGSHETVGM